MQRINTATAIDEKFTDGNPETGRKATQFNAAWCNAVQEEIANAVEKNGEVLDPKDSSQLFRATSQLKTFACAPGNFDFGEWRGSSIVRVKTLGDLIFPAKAKCPKSATVLIVFPWSADSGTSVTVGQLEGSPFGCLRGNVAFGFFDENGSLSGCFNIPQGVAFAIASFGLLSCESLKTSSIEGTNQGQGNSKYLVLGNTTVTGDLDVKGKAMLGDSMLVADPETQTLESTVPLDFGNGYKAGKELVRTDEVKTAKISAPGTTVTIAAGVEAKNVKTPSGTFTDLEVNSLTIKESVQFPSGNGLVPTLVYDIDSTKDDILSNYVGTDRNVFILLVNADSGSHTISYITQQAQGPMNGNKPIAAGEAGLFYIDGNGNAAPVS